MKSASSIRRFVVVAVLAGAATLVASTPAHAQEANDKAAAEVLFEEGRTLLKDGKTAEACPKFAESLRLDRGIGTMLFLADCWRAVGKTASAWAQFREAAELAAQAHDPREKVAARHAEALFPTLSKLTVQVTHPAKGTTISRDGRPVGEALFGSETPIDPGEHTLEASAPGYQTWKRTFTIGAASDRIVMDVPPLEKIVVAPQPIAPPPPATHPIDQVAPADDPSVGRTQRIFGIGLAIVGVAGVGIGTGFGLSAMAKNKTADAHCPAGVGCDSLGVTAGSTALTQANVSTGAFIAGGVLLVGGAVLYLAAPRARDAAAKVGLGASPNGFTLSF